MKKAMCIAAAVIFLFSLAGCAETAKPAPSESSAAPLVSEGTVRESATDQESAATASSSDSKTTIPATETEKANEPEREPLAETSGVSTEVPTETEKLQETPATQPRAADTPQPEKLAQPTEQPRPQETKPPATPEPDPTPEPAQTQPPVETSPQPTPEESQPKSAYDYEFDIEAIKADCIAIGQGMGLAVDSSLTPSNATWWNPVTASQGNQGTALKQSLESYITFHTAANLSAYGMDEITSFNIYCEARGNGSYSIYFLFA